MPNQHKPRVTATTPGYYAVVVAGEIDSSWVDHFAGMTLEAGTPGETRLSGYLPDQAALQGILEQLHSLSIPILSVVRLDVDSLPELVTDRTNATPCEEIDE